jgi:hypothetical protein
MSSLQVAKSKSQQVPTPHGTKWHTDTPWGLESLRATALKRHPTGGEQGTGCVTRSHTSRPPFVNLSTPPHPHWAPSPTPSPSPRRAHAKVLALASEASPVVHPLIANSALRRQQKNSWSQKSTQSSAPPRLLQASQAEASALRP